MDKKCKVKIKEYTYIATFYGVFQVSEIIPPSFAIGGHDGGIVNKLVAVVEYGDGMKEVSLESVFDIEAKA